MNTAAQIGRIGTLATALGIGAAVLWTAPVAWADDSSPGTAEAASPRSARTVNSPRRPGASKPAARKHSGASARSTARAATHDPISSLLNNTAPSVTASQTGQTGEGVVRGLLDVTDADGDTVGAAVTQSPVHGRVALNGLQYAYTPDPLLAHSGITDTFAVTVSDAGSGLHLHGLLGLVNLLTFGLLGTAGHASTSTVRVTVAPFNNAPTASLRVGDPDPLTGVVDGRVSGNDPNGDLLTYSGSTTTVESADAVGV